MERLPAYILAGGGSTRFGADKARAVVDGVPQLRRLAALLEPTAAEVTVVADRPDKYADLGLRTIADRWPGRGPMGGLHAAVVDRPEAGWFLAVACDTVVFRPEWMHGLLARCDRPGATAVAFRPQRWEPLLAVYHTAVRPELEDRLRRGDRAMQRLLDAVGTATPLPPDWPPLLQINTPEAYARFVGTRTG